MPLDLGSTKLYKMFMLCGLLVDHVLLIDWLRVFRQVCYAIVIENITLKIHPYPIILFQII